MKMSALSGFSQGGAGTLVLCDVFWRACDWYSYTNRAQNLHLRANACAFANAPSRIIEDSYFCFHLCACGGQRVARIRAHWRAPFRTHHAILPVVVDVTCSETMPITNIVRIILGQTRA